MIDSDGYVTKTESGGCQAGMVGTNKALMLQLFHLSLRCGIPASFGKTDKRSGQLPNGQRIETREVYTVSVGVRDYYEMLVDGCSKAQKADWSSEESVNIAFKEVDGRFYYRVDGVDRPFHSGFVYNFEVDGSHTYCANGVRTHNCYIFHEWDEKKKMWSRAVMLPPEEVYVFQYPFTDNKRVEYRPQRLIQLIKSAGDAEASEVQRGDYDRSDMNRKIVEGVPKELRTMVQREGCIVMDTDPMTGSFVHHIARRRSPYMDIGASVLERVLVPMLQKEHYRYTQLSLASRNMTPKNLISAPGLMPEELDDLRTQVDLSYMDPEYSVITNYEIHWKQIGPQERFLDFGREYEQIENQVFAAMGVTRELLTGEGQFSGTKITVEILNTMFLLTREVLKNYIEKQLFIPICEAHGWYEEDKNGVKKYYCPQIGFNRLTIRDNAEVFDSLFQLYQKGSLPVDVIYELFNLNPEEMHAKLLEDAFTVKDATFNRLLEEVNTEVGRAIPQQTDAVEKVSKYLGLKLVGKSEEQGGDGMGGDFQEGMEEQQGQQEQQGQKEQQGQEQGQEGDPESIAKTVAEKLPADASPEDIIGCRGRSIRGRRESMKELARQLLFVAKDLASRRDRKSVV